MSAAASKRIVIFKLELREMEKLLVGCDIPD